MIRIWVDFDKNIVYGNQVVVGRCFWAVFLLFFDLL